jgi:hypothetical protein
MQSHREGPRTIPGRDSLNLCEFALACLGDRPPKGVKTLVFEDGHGREGEKVRRRVIVSASDHYGLPTALDDEVLVALMQVSKAFNNFAEPRVDFTRSELISIMGWDSGGKSFRRLADSLLRWHGVQVVFENSWFDKGKGSYSTKEAIHLLEHVRIEEGAGRREAHGGKSGQGGYCSITWNGVVFRSFQEGHLRVLDTETYFDLGSAIAKRAYRYLGKHFYNAPSKAIDLHTFACEKIGMSRAYPASKIKSLLAPALEELRDKGFLGRYSCEPTGKGRWKLVMTKGSGPKSSQSETISTPEDAWHSMSPDEQESARKAAFEAMTPGDAETYRLLPVGSRKAFLSSLARKSSGP